MDALAVLVKEEVLRRGLPLEVRDAPEFRHVFNYAAITHDRRTVDFCYVLTKSGERQISVTLCEPGGEGGYAYHDDIEPLVEMARLWLLERVSPDHLTANHKEFRPNDLLRFDSADEEVTHGWDALLSLVDEYPPIMRDFIRAAHATPVLRQLQPYTSLNRVCFSRCTWWPFSDDCPRIYAGAAGQLLVRAPDNTIIECRSVDAAINTAIGLLPPNTGPAIRGTKEDIEKQ